MVDRPRLVESMRRMRSAFAAVLVAFVLLAPAGGPILAGAALGDRSGVGIRTSASIPDGQGTCDPGFVYATQSTSIQPAMNHDTCGYPGQVYSGWIGIDGQITTPATEVKLALGDHAVGWLGMTYYDIANGRALSWMQIGWMTGELSDCNPGSPISGYEMYVEWDSGFTDGPQCFMLGSLSLGSAVTYRIEFDANGCWNSFYNYNVQAIEACGFPNSMSAQATNELYNLNSSNDTTMPRSVFGSSNPNTDAALRLRGASGWQPWGTSLEAGATMQNDKRTGCPCYYISSYHEFYDELTY